MKLDKIEKLYSDNIQKYGINSRSVGWNSKESQYLRFKKLLLIIDNQSEPFSINELGCGYGELYRYLEQNQFNCSAFYGYDISQPMLDNCLSYLNAPSNLELFNSSKIKYNANYSITSGIFNTPFNNNLNEWEDYIYSTIDDLFNYSNKGIAFNFLSSYVDFRAENLHYQNPEKMFSHCIKTYGKKVRLIHDYSLYEFSILINK